MRQVVFLLKLAYLVALSYLGGTTANLVTQARFALLAKRVVSLANALCEQKYHGQLKAMKVEFAQTIALAQDRRSGVDVEALKPNELEAQFIAQQMCKSGHISTSEVHNLITQYEQGTFDAQEQAPEYSTGAAKEELTFTENPSGEIPDYPKDYGVLPLISRKAFFAFLLGILAGGLLMHYFMLVKYITPVHSTISKVRRPEL